MQISKVTQSPVIVSRIAAAIAKPSDAKAVAAKPAAKSTAQTPAAVVSLNRAPAPASPAYTAAGTKTPTKAEAPQPSAANKSASQVHAPAAKAAASPAAGAKADGPQAAGGALHSSGDGHVIVDIMSSDSGYENKIYWSSDNWATRNYLGVDNNTASVDLGSFAKGTKIQFGIDNGQGDFFKAGAASGNSDNYEHARVTSGASGMTVGFEDLRGGGDQDFNDAIIRVRGLSNGQVASPVKPEPVAHAPKPATPAPVQSPGVAPPKPEPVAQAPKPVNPAPVYAPVPTAPQNPEPAVQAPKPATPAPVQAPGATPQQPNTKDNRSGLGDGTNPGKGGGRANSPNVGTKNPNQSSNVVSSAQQAADPRLAIIDTVKKPQPSSMKSSAAVARKA